MDARIANSDSVQQCAAPFNAIHHVEDVSGSGTITEPVTLQQAKDYLRMEGFADDGSQIVQEDPITVTLADGSLTLQDNRLIGKSILSLSRSGTVYYEDTVVGNLRFTFNSTTGTVAFEVTGNTGGELVGIQYGAAGTSSGNVFTFDDTLIEQMITEGRMWVEKYTGIHVVQKYLIVTMTNQTGYYPIPGPVIGDIVMKDKSGNVLSTDEYIGSLFRKINTNQSQMITLEYTAGYSTDVPDWVKSAVLAYVTWAYEHRGEENGLPGSPVRAAAICRPHRRVQSWA